MSCLVDNTVSCVSCLPEYSPEGRHCVKRTPTPSPDPPGPKPTARPTPRPDEFPILGIVVPAALILIAIVALVVFCVYTRCRKLDDAYYILVRLPKADAKIISGHHVNKDRHLIIPTTPNVKVSSLKEDIQSAFVNEYGDSQTQLHLLIPTNKNLPDFDTLGKHDIPSGSLMELKPAHDDSIHSSSSAED